MLYTDRFSDHWTVAELCRASEWSALEAFPTAQDNLRLLVSTALEPLRIMWGAPIFCVSGFRSLAHNTAIGGASQSQHMMGRAADVVPADIDWAALRAGHGTQAGADRLAKFAALVEHSLSREMQSVGGVGLYPGWVHCDIRPRGLTGHVARWPGKDFGSER